MNIYGKVFEKKDYSVNVHCSFVVSVEMLKKV